MEQRNSIIRSMEFVTVPWRHLALQRRTRTWYRAFPSTIYKETNFISWPTVTVLSLPSCLKWNNGSYFTPNNGDRQLSHSFTFPSSRGDVHWTVAVVSRRVFRQYSVTVVCLLRVATSYSSPDTLKWTLYLAKHCTALIATIFQSLCVWNILEKCWNLHFNLLSLLHTFQPTAVS